MLQNIKVARKNQMKRSVVVRLLFCTLMLSKVSECQKIKQKVPALFVFGDSLSDNGNNNYIASLAKANFFPYGIDFPYGPTGRFCNGKTVPDYIGEFLGLPLVPPYLDPSAKGSKIMHGVNYASAAGGILDETGLNYVARISFNLQISNFQNTVKDIASQLENAQALAKYLSESLFIFSFGSNDYINNYLKPTLYFSTRLLYSAKSFRDHLISEYSRQLTMLYNLGARKIVLSLIGPLGCIPEQLASAGSLDGHCVKDVNDLVEDFNYGIKGLVNTLNQDFPGATFVYHDTYAITMDIINNSKLQGFIEASEGCCGVGRYHGELSCNSYVSPCSERKRYVFWDAFHPTQAVNLILAKNGFDGGLEAAYPINIRQLLELTKH